MTSIETDGFLADEILQVIKEFRSADPQFHQDYRDLGRLAHISKNNFAVSNKNIQQLMVVLLFGRLLGLYEAVYIMACRGMSPELTYSSLCQPSHVDSRDLQRMFKLKSTEEIEGVFWGPDHEGVIFNLTTAMDFLLQGLVNPSVPMLSAASEAVAMWRAKIKTPMLANPPRSAASPP